MKILILDSLEPALLNELMGDNIVYRPDLLNKNLAALGAALVACDVDAVLAQRSLPDAAMEQWRTSRAGPAYCIQVHVEEDAATSDPAPGRDPANDPNLPAARVTGVSEREAYIAALTALEEQCARAHAPLPPSFARQAAGKRVLLIGAGLVNLITAHYLRKAGYCVTMLDANPDPRDAAPWTAYGCSRGGDDARMFTLSEMDNYNDREISGDMNKLFQHTVSDAGWNVHWAGTLARSEQGWGQEFQSIPPWLANRYNDDIFTFTRESWPAWQQWIEDDPDLFEGSVLRDGILRLYSDPAQFSQAVQRQNRIGATVKIMTPAQLADRHPALEAAVVGGHVAGAVHVVGFTINAHKFIDLLLDRLAAEGVQFNWNQRAQTLLRDGQGRVRGVRTQTQVIESDHYVISPGAYGAALLDETKASGKVHGVLGAWLRVPNIEPQLQHSLKLARKGHITEDANITVATDRAGSPVLIIGSGYGYTGIDPRNVDPSLLNQIYQGLVDTAAKYFPAAYQLASDLREIESSFKYCVRPWTASSLGIFDAMEAANHGRCIVTGGHNTGGFAQAPATAQAVLATLNGHEHRMHFAYHPQRSAHFLSPTPAVAESRAATLVAG